MSGLTKQRLTDLEVENAALKKALGEKISLRDQFAIAALTGIISSGVQSTPGGKVDAAYTYADLMLMRKAEDDKQN
jgi:hypothetical protein